MKNPNILHACLEIASRIFHHLPDGINKNKKKQFTSLQIASQIREENHGNVDGFSTHVFQGVVTVLSFVMCVKESSKKM